MSKENDSENIERFINGQANDNEKAWVESQFLNGEDNFTLRHLLKNDWDLMLRDSTPVEVNLSHLLDRVHHIIRKNETLKKQKPRQKLIRIYMNAAAILLLPLLIAGGLVFSYLGNHGKSTTDQLVSSTIYAPLGARVSFNLPDGTTGMLNSGSKLSYTLPFTNNRQVKLKGEAWLEVNRDEDHPFEINTCNSTVKVLGTNFNVSAYPAENYVEVVLQKGSVEFQDNKGDEKVTMVPSERLVFQNGNISKSVTDPAKYSAWTEGKLVFRSDPMAEVARRIERWYNVKIILADSELEKYSFRATFLDDTLEEVLRCLSMTSPIRYRITPRELMQDGTYKKEEVIIHLKK
ncbi:MAG: FecR domain-containing protein [Bacteroidales bacterium]|jgi:ferric-dicitrate binding protein FerR (iron transport regulator)